MVVCLRPPCQEADYSESQQVVLYNMVLQASRKADVSGVLQWQLWDLKPGASSGGGRAVWHRPPENNAGSEDNEHVRRALKHLREDRLTRSRELLVAIGNAVRDASGNMDVDRLEELLGVRPERRGAATVAGLVSDLAGRIPKKGEVVEEDT